MAWIAHIFLLFTYYFEYYLPYNLELTDKITTFMADYKQLKDNLIMKKVLLLTFFAVMSLTISAQNKSISIKPEISTLMSQKLARACKKYPKTMGMALVKSNDIHNDNQYNASLFLMEKGSDKICEKLLMYLHEIHGAKLDSKLLNIGFTKKEVEIAKKRIEYKSKIPVATVLMSKKLALACKNYPQTMGRAFALCTKSETTSALNWKIALLEEGDEELCEKLLVYLYDITKDDFAENLTAIGFDDNEVNLSKKIVAFAAK